MSRRNKIIIIAATAVLIVLLVVIGVLWWLNRPQVVTPLPEIDTSVGIQIPTALPQASSGPNNAEISLVGEPQLEASLKAIAFTFTERFGSYSNEGNFSNLDSIEDLMTVRMKAWTQNYKVTQRALADEGQIYYGITTQALSADILDFDETLGRAEIEMETQRRETKKSTINPRVFYQNLKLDLVNTGDGWKVDAAQWQ